MWCANRFGLYSAGNLEPSELRSKIFEFAFQNNNLMSLWNINEGKTRIETGKSSRKVLLENTRKIISAIRKD